MSEISSLKNKLRQELQQKRHSLTVVQRQSLSQSALSHLTNYLQQTYPDGVQLLCYRALPFEVDTSALFVQCDYPLFAPRMLPDAAMEWVRVEADTAWQKMTFGVFEPESGELWEPGELSVLITPLLGFDKKGSRLGMGKGYFDRWLERFGGALDGQIGMAFSCQQVQEIPMEPHDVPLSMVITELGVISCRN